MKSQLTSALILATSMMSASSQDKAKPWSSVSFSVPHETTAASVELVSDGSLNKVNLSLVGKSIDIPETELEGIDDPVLHSAELLFGEDWYGEWKEGEKATPHYIIEMSYGKKTQFGSLPSVQFLFHSGEFQQRIVLIQKSKTMWEEFRKDPGEEPVMTGTTTRAAPVNPQPVTEAK